MMRLVDLIVESSDSNMTGNKTIDSIVSAVDAETTLSPGLPVRIEKSDWETLHSPTRLARSFKFSDIKKLQYFVNELINRQEVTGHHASILIESDTVTVETFTHDFGSVTKLDQDLASFCDEVYEDTRYFK